MEKDFREQWPEVDKTFFKEFIQIHNQAMFGKIEEKDYDNFILQNKEKFNNPDYLQIFSLKVELDEDYLKANEEVCTIFYHFMKDNPDWSRLDFDLRSSIRLGIFYDMFEEVFGKETIN